LMTAFRQMSTFFASAREHAVRSSSSRNALMRGVVSLARRSPPILGTRCRSGSGGNASCRRPRTTSRPHGRYRADRQPP
jgi:hypothetical protein